MSTALSFSFPLFVFASFSGSDTQSVLIAAINSVNNIFITVPSSSFVGLVSLGASLSSEGSVLGAVVTTKSPDDKDEFSPSYPSSMIFFDRASVNASRLRNTSDMLSLSKSFKLLISLKPEFNNSFANSGFI